jgi:hypothetical protein
MQELKDVVRGMNHQIDPLTCQLVAHVVAHVIDGHAAIGTNATSKSLSINASRSNDPGRPALGLGAGQAGSGKQGVAGYCYKNALDEAAQWCNV